MKKSYYPILWGILIIIGVWIYFFSNWDETLVNLISINIFLFIIRIPLRRLSASVIKKRLLRGIISAIFNIIWIVFAFWLLFTISPDTFIALLSFILIAVSLTFRSFINNVTSGALILTSEQFEIGDLIETNGVQGRVKEINLNYTVISEFDGVRVIIPNSSVYGAILTKFTHRKYIYLPPPEPGASERRIKRYRKYLKYLNKLLSEQPKTTKYVKQVELLSSVDPLRLDEYLEPVFEKYKEVFGIKPDYVVDTIAFTRCKINLYVMSAKPELIVNNIDAFLRDVIFQLYNDEIYEGWEEYLQEINNNVPKNKEAVK